MGRVRRFGAAVCLAAGLAAGSAQAIVINDDAGGGDPQARMLALAAPFQSVAQVLFDTGSGTSRCSGSLISATALLTADHCARDFTAAQTTVRFSDGDGTGAFTRAAASIATLDPNSAAPGQLLNGADLAVITFADPVLDRDPFRLLAGIEFRELATFVGYGRWGTGTTGAVNGSDGKRRAARNVIDTFGLAPGPDPLTAIAGSTNIYTSDFDDPDGTSNTLGWSPIVSSALMSPDEGTTGPGDSGGPLLVRRGTEWLILGVLSGGTPGISGYGDLTYWTGVGTPATRAFVESFGGVYAPVPLPAGGLLLAAALGALALRRARAG